jgi:DMSO/TMAO reductase YedYZ molybdopterin-dependent catalytic subunit
MSKKTDLTWDRLRGVLAENGAHPDDLDRFDVVASRRRFLGQMGALTALAGFGAGVEATLQGLFGRGLIPAAWAAEAAIPGKPGMLVHNDRPVNGEFPPHLLDDDITPTERHFVRNNGLVPERAANKDLQGWGLTIDGEVNKTLSLTLDDLKKMPAVTLALTIECGGNGRGNFDPKVRGNPWDRGAIGCSRWTGVRLADLFKQAGLKDRAVYTAHYGEDPPIGKAEPFSRGVPIAKAMDPHTLVVYKMNGGDLAELNGYPVRLVVPGWIGSCSQKWLTRIWVRDKVHDADKMKGSSYRVPPYPVAPGSQPPKGLEWNIATSWIAKSMITRPAAGSKFDVGQSVKARGHAWAGDNKVKKVLVSSDYGVSWSKAKLMRGANKYAWDSWEAELSFPLKGYYEIWARAFDDKGNAQPFTQPWNPKGYLGNVVHRIPVTVAI